MKKSEVWGLFNTDRLHLAESHYVLNVMHVFILPVHVYCIYFIQHLILIQGYCFCNYNIWWILGEYKIDLETISKLFKDLIALPFNFLSRFIVCCINYHTNVMQVVVKVRYYRIFFLKIEFSKFSVCLVV